MSKQIPNDMNPHYAAGYAQHLMREEGLAEATFSYRGEKITIYSMMTFSDVERLFTEAAGGGK